MTKPLVTSPWKIIMTRSMINRTRHILKPKSFLLCITLFIVTIWTYTSYYSLTAVYNDKLNEIQSYTTNDNSGYLIKTSGCRIPEMYLNGSDIDKYMFYNFQINCKSWKYTLPLVTSNLTALIINTDVLATLNIENSNSMFCYYTPLKTPKLENNQEPNEHSDNVVRRGKKTYFTNDVTVQDEMVEVICELNKKVIYNDYHIFIHPAPSVLNRKDGDVSVLILGLDAVSRLNFHRQMPKTSAFLSQLHNVEMLGYNKVEDNTFPNLVPVLSGLSVEELKKECWPKDEEFFDKCHFVWDDFKNKNFSTAFAEDSPMIGVFNYIKRGFLNSPTDHYLRPIMIQAEENIGHEHHGNTKICLGSQLGMTALFNYAFKYALSMSNHLYMAMFWSTSLTHDYVEYPSIGDNDLQQLFGAFNESGEFNRTVVILMSDHGIRWGDYRNTYQGGLEDRLPMLRFIIPEWFKTMYPKAIKNLNENVLRLTTPYDLHETLLDLIDTKALDDNSIERRMKTNENQRGKSLFLEISGDRTCENAGIPKHYCACHDKREILDVDDVNVIKATKCLMNYIHFELSTFQDCANLSLHQINRATVEIGRDTDSVKDYEIQVTTVPGFAKFEATVRQTNDQFKMVGSISRLNLYGNQSICVHDSKIKLLCYCIN